MRTRLALVTGASGFIGSHLVLDLVRRGWKVRALVHSRPLPTGTAADIVRGDIQDLSLIKKNLKGVDVVFHLASALGFSRIGREEFFRINAGGTETVLQAAREAGVKRVVHFSSAGVLGHVPSNTAADEGHPLSPRDLYDRSKLEGERIARRYAEEGLDLVVIRPGWVYGPGDRRTFKLIKAVADGLFFMPGSGRTLQTPVHIRDLLAGTALCLERGRRGEVYHLAGGQALPVRDIVAAIARAAGRKPPRLRLPLLPVKTAAWLMGRAFSLAKKEAPLSLSRLAFFIHPKPLSIHKAVDELDFAPSINFEDGMRETVCWYRENGWL
ncbi:MAG TPA: NAD-dependent epimerase/dehydratase family protein [Acidobacteriota bacterium]